MEEEFDTSFKELEQTIMDDMKQRYSETTIDHFLNPRNLGELPGHDGLGRITGPCGDTMQICLKVKNGRIADVAFWTDGCGPSIASGSMVTVLARDKSVQEAQRITQQDVLEGLDGLPEENRHCALLAANALKEAIKDYQASRNDSWKRPYRQGPKGL